MICTDTDNYVNVLTIIKKEKKKKRTILDLYCEGGIISRYFLGKTLTDLQSLL